MGLTSNSSFFAGMALKKREDPEDKSKAKDSGEDKPKSKEVAEEKSKGKEVIEELSNCSTSMEAKRSKSKDTSEDKPKRSSYSNKATRSKVKSPKSTATKALMAPPPSHVANRLRSSVLPPFGEPSNELIDGHMVKRL